MYIVSLFYCISYMDAYQCSPPAKNNSLEVILFYGVVKTLLITSFWCPGSGWEARWHWGGEREVRVAVWEQKRIQGTSLPTTGTAKGKCLNHLKLQRHGSVTVANGNRVCLRERLACLGRSLLLSVPPSLTSTLLTLNCLRNMESTDSHNKE